MHNIEMQNKSRSKNWKLVGSIAIMCCLVFLIVGVVFFAHMFFAADFDESNFSSPSQQIALFDYEENLIPQSFQDRKFVKLEKIKNETVEAFISIEDKNFRSHSGINVKRILAAAVSNLKTRSNSQGASTISQQLIKNTHLSSQKTLQRKLNEIFITLKMERALEKNEIMEAYLNEIYFGSGCHGIASASEFYFDSTVEKLELEESALLAAMIKAPQTYSPIFHPEKALSRRNLVINEMIKDGKITKLAGEKAKQKPLLIAAKNNNFSNSYSRESLREAQKILGLTSNQISKLGFQIETYFNAESQLAMSESFESENTETTIDGVMISICPTTGGVSAYCSNSMQSVFDVRRQPGSVIKPVLVYAPAIDQNLIYPCSKILDEKITFGEYSPNNIGGTFDGFVSTKDAVAKSLNVPAIKVLSYVGIEKAKAYAKDAGIPFDSKDVGYAIGLGGFTNGITALETVASFTPFVNNGNHVETHFVKRIKTKKGITVWENSEKLNKVFGNDTAFLTSKMLTPKNPKSTGKILGKFNFDIGVKTGTVGTTDGKHNTDSSCIAFTTKDVTFAWQGKFDGSHMSNFHTGGRQPARMIEKFYDQIHKNAPPENFEKPQNVVVKEIDSEEYEKNNVVVLANEFTPQKFVFNEFFSTRNVPKESSKKEIEILIPEIEAEVESNFVKLMFDGKKEFSYELFEKTKQGEILKKSFDGTNGKLLFEEKIKKGEMKTFFLVVSLKSSKNANKDLKGVGNDVVLINP